jgi:hypothetical protein
MEALPASKPPGASEERREAAPAYPPPKLPFFPPMVKMKDFSFQLKTLFN